jgi:AAA+ superfamily predicted ATPase
MMNNFDIPLKYLRDYIKSRLAVDLNNVEPTELRAEAYLLDNSAFAQWMQEKQPAKEEYIALLLALAPYLQPAFFEDIIKEFVPEGGQLIEMGGIKGVNHRGMLPTGETLLFILAGNDVNERVRLQQELIQKSRFFQQEILSIESVPFGEPSMSGRLLLAEETIDYWLRGVVSYPKFSAEFAAQYISTDYEWADVVLNEDTLQYIKEIENWVKFHPILVADWEIGAREHQGYRALFHGQPGTGKTMVAKLLGKSTGLDVFKIDLSKIVSKYIGETEKNLARIFDKAEHKKWILFFDEADALFGKRTEVRDAHDRYANQEVSYLLQRIEQYSGLIILASNFKSNIDDAFLRRFQNIVYFPIPNEVERLQLWKKAFPKKMLFTSELNWEKVAQEHQLTGSNISNIAYYCCLALAAKQEKTLDYSLLTYAIQREMIKEGKM